MQAAHLCVDRFGKYLFTANYGNGSISMLEINPADGSLEDATEYRFGKV